ncbi:MAG: Uma2 family endonuclease [Pirellulaceae bacterium]|nr:Uma2 family endonuclease [Pirellulaceae bacterium]
MSALMSEVPETRMVLQNVSWETFVALADERRGSVPRMTYNEGVLEMMSPKRKHENIGRLIGRMIEVYSEIKGIEILSVASVTVKRSDLKKAYEADESYYVTNIDQVLVKEELDFEVDPAPDLVIEVELTSSAIDKLELFSAMHVHEVWRHDGTSVQFYRWVDGSYEPIQTSIELPGLDAALINRFLEQRLEAGETTFIRAFRSEIQ